MKMKSAVDEVDMWARGDQECKDPKKVLTLPAH